MKKILLLVSFFFSTVSLAYSQECKRAVKYKGQNLVIEEECDLFAEQGLFSGPKVKTGGTYVSLILDKQARASIITLARKAINWGQINRDKNFAFRKLLGEVSAHAETLYRSEINTSDVTTGSYNALEIVFDASGGNNYKVVLYGDMRNAPYYTVNTSKGKKTVARKPEFDIDSPGSPLLTFVTEREIQELVGLLEKEPINLGEIFK